MNVVPTVPPTLSMGTPMILTVMATVFIESRARR
jgi:hypothetical protein